MCINLLWGSNKSSASAWQLYDSQKICTNIANVQKQKWNKIYFTAAASITTKYNTGLKLDKRIRNGMKKHTKKIKDH